MRNEVADWDAGRCCVKLLQSSKLFHSLLVDEAEGTGSRVMTAVESTMELEVGSDC